MSTNYIGSTMTIATLLQLTGDFVAEISDRFSNSTFTHLPKPILENVMHRVSCKELERLHEVFNSRGLSSDDAWRRHCMLLGLLAWRKEKDEFGLDNGMSSYRSLYHYRQFHTGIGKSLLLSKIRQEDMQPTYPALYSMSVKKVQRMICYKEEPETKVAPCGDNDLTFLLQCVKFCSKLVVNGTYIRFIVSQERLLQQLVLHLQNLTITVSSLETLPYTRTLLRCLVSHSILQQVAISGQLLMSLGRDALLDIMSLCSGCCQLCCTNICLDLQGRGNLSDNGFEFTSKVVRKRKIETDVEECNINSKVSRMSEETFEGERTLGGNSYVTGTNNRSVRYAADLLHSCANFHSQANGIPARATCSGIPALETCRCSGVIQARGCSEGIPPLATCRCSGDIPARGACRCTGDIPALGCSGGIPARTCSGDIPDRRTCESPADNPACDSCFCSGGIQAFVISGLLVGSCIGKTISQMLPLWRNLQRLSIVYIPELKEAVLSLVRNKQLTHLILDATLSDTVFESIVHIFVESFEADNSCRPMTLCEISGADPLICIQDPPKFTNELFAVTKLDLSGNVFNADAFDLLVNFVKVNIALRSLNLKSCFLPNAQTSRVLKALSQKDHQSLEDLNIANNRLDMCGQELETFLTRNSLLSTLQLENIQLATALDTHPNVLEALVQLPCLQDLNISRNNLGELNQPIAPLASILSRVRALKHLSVAFNHYAYSDLVACTDLINGRPSFHRLDTLTLGISNFSVDNQDTLKEKYSSIATQVIVQYTGAYRPLLEHLAQM